MAEIKPEIKEKFGKKFFLIAGAVAFLGVAGLVFVLNRDKQGGFPSPDDFGFAEASPFADVRAQDESFAAIKYLWREGALQADTDGNFHPESPMTRAQWAEFLVRLTGANPDPEIDRECFGDVGGKSFEPAVCHAWKQGWMASESGWNAPQGQSFFRLIEIAQAREEDGFAPEQPVKTKEAAGSLARAANWPVEGAGGKITDEAAVEFAEKAGIVKPGAADAPLTRAEGAGVVFKSLATVSLGQESYDQKLNHAVESSRLGQLVDTAASGQDAGYARRRHAYLSKYTEDFGAEKAAELVDKSGSEQDLYKNVRHFRYERTLAEEKAAGKEAKPFDALAPLQSLFASKSAFSGGAGLAAEDVMISRASGLTDYKQQETTDTKFSPRESARVMVFLDENYQLVKRADWGRVKIQYYLGMSISSHYGEGWTNDPHGIGAVDIDFVNFHTGVIEHAGASYKFEDKSTWFDRRAILTSGNLTNMTRAAMQDLETRLGHEIKPAPRTREESGYRPLVPDEVRNPKSSSGSGQTAWGDAFAQETAYENYFWLYVQDPGEFSSFWEIYNDATSGIGQYWHTLPLGASVDLRAYFESAGAKARYEELLRRQIESVQENPDSLVRMSSLNDFLENIDIHQANLEMAKPEGKPKEEPSPVQNQDQGDLQANPETEETLRKMRECYSRPLPQTEAERQEQLRQDMDPTSSCYNSQIKLCSDGSYGICLNDSPGSGWTESR